MPDWERALASLGPGHYALHHRGPAAASRFAARFSADGLAAGDAVVLAAEPAELERIALALTGASIDVEQAQAGNHLLLVHADAVQAEQLATGLASFLGWVEEQAAGRPVRLWNHWAGALAEAGDWRGARALEEAISGLGTGAIVACHLDLDRIGNVTPSLLESTPTLHDGLFLTDPEGAVEFTGRRLVAPLS